MVKNLPSNSGDAGSIPGWGTKIPHAAGNYACAPQLLSLRTSTREPACYKLQSPRALEPASHDYRKKKTPQATTREKPGRRNERSRVPQLRPDAIKKKKKERK